LIIKVPASSERKSGAKRNYACNTVLSLPLSEFSLTKAE